MKTAKIFLSIAVFAVLGIFLVAAQAAPKASKGKAKQTKGETKMEQTDKTKSKILIAYFSRTGEQYGVGVISKGNTEIAAEIIAAKTGGTLFEIKPKDDKYPKAYKDLIKYAKDEMKDNARPELSADVKNFADYDTVFIGYPVWWGDKPMPVYTFIEKHDFKGKTIIPFATHEGSGFCGTQGMSKTGATVREGLGIYGHVAQNERKQAEKEITEWLEGLGL
jgi:flavodoxin